MKTNKELIDIAAACLQLLSNACGAEFEDETLAVDIIAETIYKSTDNKWVSVKDSNIPMDGKEYLTRNDLQGGIFSLVRYSHVAMAFKIKGELISIANAGTHWMSIPPNDKTK